METCFSKELGGIRLRINSQMADLPQTDFFQQPPLYQINKSDLREIRLDVFDREYEGFEKLSVQFQTDGMWQYYKNQKKTCIAYKSKTVKKPYFVAEFSEDFSHGEIFCSKDLPGEIRNPFATPWDQIFFMHIIIIFIMLLS